MNWSGMAPTGGAARPIRPRRIAALTESFEATVPITLRGGGRGGTSVGRSGAVGGDRAAAPAGRRTRRRRAPSLTPHSRTLRPSSSARPCSDSR